MYEVEVKVPAPHDPVRERLDDLEADPLGAVDQVDTYYDHPTRDFAETDEVLRLRRESPRDEGDEVAVLTYKGPRVDDRSKSRQEVETGLDDPAATDGILHALGFDAAATVEKSRERYALDGFVIALDEVAGLGQFVEVEAEGEVAAIETLREGAFEVCRALDLDPDESVRTSYLGLLLAADE